MQRWFFASEHVICKEDPTPTASPLKTPSTPSIISVQETCWKFNVKFHGTLCCNETLAVCGSCPVLGNWNVQQCLDLSKTTDSSHWTLTIMLPRKYNVYYRYLICATNGRGRKIVRFWETHFEARLLRGDQEQAIGSEDCDIFGMLNNKYKIERGWLTTHIVVVQFKFYCAPFILSDFKPLLYMKITPLKIKLQEECEVEISPKLKFSPSMESQFIGDDKSLTFAYCEVAKLQQQGGEFRYQPKFGTSCGSNDILMFHLTLADFEHTAYLIDLYHYPPKAGADLPPYHFGYQYIFPQHLKDSSEGILGLNIVCATKHRSIGSMNCNYLVVRPMSSHDFNMQKTFQRHWNTEHDCLNVGHRGCGGSFRFHNNILRENTIHSFNLEFEHGAEMVKFDVQLTKDLVPILYDDFQLYVSKNSVPNRYDVMRFNLDTRETYCPKTCGRKLNSGLVGYPINKFTLKQLKCVTEIPKNVQEDRTCNTVNPKYNEPFQTLDNVFRKVDSKLGFMIEIKWPQKYNDSTMQESLRIDIDKNDYVDIILDLVLKMADSRRIIFSSLDADICTMIRLKQNRYPVLFSIPTNIGNKKFMDPRGNDINTGINFANTMELLGIIAKCADIIEMPGKVLDIHELNLCIFCWGGEALVEKTRNYLKALGVDGIIFDRINHVLEPEDLKHNIFVIE